MGGLSSGGEESRTPVQNDLPVRSYVRFLRISNLAGFHAREGRRKFQPVPRNFECRPGT